MLQALLAESDHRRAAAQWTFDDHYRRLMRVFDEVAARKQAA
jgi:hypothetical protein